MPIAEQISAYGTLAAAFFAAISAYASFISAKEAGKSRKSQISPRITLEKDFSIISLSWPNGKDPGGPISIKSKNEKSELVPSMPSLTVSNFGGSPAVEISILFELECREDSELLPEDFKEFNLSIGEAPSLDKEEKVKLLKYPGSYGEVIGIPIHNREYTYIPSCAPGQEKSFIIPNGITNRIFLHGLEMKERRMMSGRPDFVRLSISMQFHDTEGFQHKADFAFSVSPFLLAKRKPLVVSTSLQELPVKGFAN